MKPMLSIHVTGCDDAPHAEAETAAQQDTDELSRLTGKNCTYPYSELSVGAVMGKGASSVVVSAVHAPTRTRLALKVVNVSDKSKRSQLLKELTLLYNIRPMASIVTFHGAYLRDGHVAIALEYLDAGSLHDVVSRAGALPEAAVASLAFQAAWGLAYLKTHKRVHRDVKPSNLLVNLRGEVKLSDFGISSELRSSIAMCGTFVGTFKYMSPERVQNLPYSYASDVWGLGIVLFECATGEYPYKDCSSCIDLVQTITEVGPPRLPVHASRDLRDLVVQCCCKAPGERLPAEVVLGAPFLQRHGVCSLEDGVAVLARFLRASFGGR